METINLEKFRSYENLKKSGAIIMSETHEVMARSGLSRVEILEIQLHYEHYKSEFPQEKIVVPEEKLVFEETITKEEFLRYDNVRMEGKVGLTDLDGMLRDSGLAKDKIFEIMRDYTYYKEKFEGKKK